MSRQVSTPLPLAGEQDRAPAVQGMFDRISPRYDRANRILSLGMDQGWRRQVIETLGEPGQGEVLDLCAGTLDLTVALLERGWTRIHAVDFSQGMLDAGAAKLPADAPVELHCADARELPLDDDSVDAIVCAFGLRNVPEVERALAECVRVLRPGGQLVVLDFFHPEGWCARMLQGTWNRAVLPLLGGVITGSPGSYRYLAESIVAHGSRKDFELALADLGFEVEGRDMWASIASLVSGRLLHTVEGSK